jgi:hypothetical protein
MAADSFGPKNEPEYAGSGVPADAADLTEIAKFAARVGNTRTDTSNVRKALTGKDVWPGLTFVETDTGLTYQYLKRDSSTGWVRQAVHSGGTFFDDIAADGTTQISHGLGVTPTDVQITPQTHPTSDQISLLFEPILFGSPSGTRFNVRLKDLRTNAWASGAQKYRLQWHAFASAQ